MSKNFEEEYKKLALDEVPDLWDRIEAGLSKKSAPAACTSGDQGEAAEKQDRAHRKKNGRQGKTVSVFFRRYAGAVAAVFCVFIIIPAVMLIRRSGEETEAEVEEPAAAEADWDGAVNATAAEAVCEEAVTEEACEGAAEEPAAEDYKEAAEELRAAGTMTGDGAASSGEYMQQKAESESVKEKMADQAGKVSVKIKAESEEAENSGGTSDGRRYEAIVVNDASGQLTEGEQIVIFIPASSNNAVTAAQKVLEMDLVYDPELDVYVMQKLY